MRKRQVSALTGIVCVFSLASAAHGFSAEPELEVSGIVQDTKGSVAVVNDTFVREGDTVAGAKIVRITADGVIFRSNDHEFTRKISGTFKNIPPPASSPSPEASAVPPQVSPQRAQQSLPHPETEQEDNEEGQGRAAERPAETIPSMPMLSGPQAELYRSMLKQANDVKARADARAMESYLAAVEMEHPEAGDLVAGMQKGTIDPGTLQRYIAESGVRTSLSAQQLIEAERSWANEKGD